ncbi:MAG: (2E,6E)-farnesyl diphosphate synthase [Gammaproteobacteria bacterium]|nr:(2E,6E)-farnesyl diphosphate synthase [Gammaproteobacteria bacterium]MDH5650869.1 (2E,6E)-farnesyl diphosphate synthase [Gammaproteobacteria bacterium]
MKLDSIMQQWQARIDQVLLQWLPPDTTTPTPLHKAMRYAVLNGGKRIRPLLVYAAGQTVSSHETGLDAVAAAVEMIHAYSLVHDDLPAMDNDDLRRGKPTCHKAFNEATAILAGDALQCLAFHIMARHLPTMIPAETRLEMLDILAVASGSRGMAGGQAIDLESVGKTLTIAELENMHIHKTGALIRASVKLGAMCNPQITPEQLDLLDHYAKCIGLAFQIHDDVLDEIADTNTLGKTQGADRALNKPTYPALMGLEEARQMAVDLHHEALQSLRDFDAKADVLRQIARYIIEREY